MKEMQAAARNKNRTRTKVLSKNGREKKGLNKQLRQSQQKVKEINPESQNITDIIRSQNLSLNVPLPVETS